MHYFIFLLVIIMTEASDQAMDEIFARVRTSRYINNVPPIRLEYVDNYGKVDLVWAARENQLGGEFILLSLI